METNQSLKNNHEYKKYYNIYDQVVLKTLPFYVKMHKEIINLIENDKSKATNVLKLGFGTGTLTYRILKEFPNAEVLGIDAHDENISKATEKLKGFPNFKYIKADFRNFKTDQVFDTVVSALSIHHLSDKEKLNLFKLIFDKLKTGGKFIIGDMVKSTDEEEWHKFLVDTMGQEGEYRWQRHKNNKEDQPSTIENQLDWLRQVGFDKIKIVNKWFNFYLFYGEKSSTN